MRESLRWKKKQLLVSLVLGLNFRYFPILTLWCSSGEVVDDDTCVLKTRRRPDLFERETQTEENEACKTRIEWSEERRRIRRRKTQTDSSSCKSSEYTRQSVSCCDSESVSRTGFCLPLELLLWVGKGMKRKERQTIPTTTTSSLQRNSLRDEQHDFLLFFLMIKLSMSKYRKLWKVLSSSV